MNFLTKTLLSARVIINTLARGLASMFKQYFYNLRVIPSQSGIKRRVTLKERRHEDCHGERMRRKPFSLTQRWEGFGNEKSHSSEPEKNLFNKKKSHLSQIHIRVPSFQDFLQLLWSVPRANSIQKRKIL
jgi:hypothetical protein